MKSRPSKHQSGYALIMFVLAIMGAGGLLLVEFTEGMRDAFESKKFEHNKRVLKEAKQALLQFAYNYPVTNNGGPGRLPCADIGRTMGFGRRIGACAVPRGRGALSSGLIWR